MAHEYVYEGRHWFVGVTKQGQVTRACRSPEEADELATGISDGETLAHGDVASATSGDARVLEVPVPGKKPFYVAYADGEDDWLGPFASAEEASASLAPGFRR